MTDMNDLPIVDLPGSETWLSGYELGQELEKRFPGQDGGDLASAMTYNGRGPFTTVEQVTDLVLEHQGENDGDNWIWLVSFADGSTWTAEGGCDYTGWDCQSNLDWCRAVS